MKKWKIRLLLAVLFVSLLGGCGSKKEEYPYYISYVNSGQTQTVRMGYEPEHTGGAEIIQELLDQLSTDTDRMEYVKAIPEGVEILGWEQSEDCLRLDFNDKYSQMNAVTEILCRLAIVQTMTQVDGVESVRFFVEGEPLRDQKGNKVGRMTTDSFVENPGEQINSFQNATIELYFADTDGDGLVRETQAVYYNSNISMEKLVMEHLLSGPRSGSAKKTIPDETNLINVAVVDGSCYVILDEGFLNQNYEIQEPIVIYSIVNSLAALNNVQRVQISVNGNTSGVYRDSFKLSEMYEPDYSYVKEHDSRSVVVSDVKEENGAGN